MGYLEAFKNFQTQFLQNRKSIFRDDEDQILTPESVAYLVNNFVNNGNDDGENFIKKIKQQLVEQPPHPQEEIIRNAIEVLATAVWLWRLPLCKTSVRSREKSVLDILNLVDGLTISTHNPYFSKDIEGVATPGRYYFTNKAFELAYIIRFFEQWLNSENPPDALGILLNSLTVDGNIGKVAIQTNGSDQPKIKSVAVYNALLHLFDPDNYVPALSFKHKRQMVDAFTEEVDDTQSDDDKLKGIIKSLRDKDPDFKTIDFYKPQYREIWDPTILPGKNVIYYGAPGTGKTYHVTGLVKQKVGMKRDHFVVQQFHPSFGYEEFIDGIKPAGLTGGAGIQFELVNGEFKELCIKAFEELVLAHREERPATQFYFIADEINRAELSRVFGELLLCLEEDKRLRYDKDNNLQGMKIKTQNSKLWEKKHAVVVLNKDGVVDRENGDEYFFGVPENLYFLGTMNDIDRSIDSFDLALRRRFKWVRKNCDYDVITEDLLSREASDETIDKYVSDGKEKGVPKGRCQLLNSYISDTLNLGSSYELGHSYFMEIKLWNGKITESAYKRLFDSEIGPLVAEYLRAECPSGKELESKLEDMRSLFTVGKARNQ